MNFLYYARVFDDNTYKKTFTKNTKPLIAASKFNKLFGIGIAKNKNNLVFVSQLPTSRRNVGLKFICLNDYSSDFIKIKYLKYVELPILKQLMIFLGASNRAFMSNCECIIVDVLPLFMSLGATIGGRLSHKKVIDVVTDLPCYMYGNSKTKMNISNAITKNCDGFVLLTKYMVEKLNTHNKPYFIMEGMCDNETMSVDNEKKSNDIKSIVYAGGLKKEYGIEILCKAFLKLNLENVELHIFGDGDYRQNLETLCKNNSNIVYHGVCPNYQVMEFEKSATLLVNPRPRDAEYTRYSFPSKVIEYMSTGTPVLMLKLDGIPNEYYEYTFNIDNLDENILCEKIKEILSMDNEYLLDFGEKAKQFVLDKKNNIIQSGNFLNWLEKNIK